MRARWLVTIVFAVIPLVALADVAFDAAAINASYDGFMKRVLEEQWPGHYKVDTRAPELRDLAGADWAALAGDRDGVGGKYTFNPELADRDLAKLAKKIEIVQVPDLDGAHLADVASHVYKTYAKDYYVPGLELLKWIADHPDSAPAALKDTKVKGLSYWAFGSLTGLPDVDDGGWAVPSVHWVAKRTHADDPRSEPGFHFGVRPIGRGNWMDKNDRVLLVRR